MAQDFELAHIGTPRHISRIVADSLFIRYKIWRAMDCAGV
jgi:hypothetical protein